MGREWAATPTRMPTISNHCPIVGNADRSQLCPDAVKPTGETTSASNQSLAMQAWHAAGPVCACFVLSNCPLPHYFCDVRVKKSKTEKRRRRGLGRGRRECGMEYGIRASSSPSSPFHFFRRPFTSSVALFTSSVAFVARCSIFLQGFRPCLHGCWRRRRCSQSPLRCRSCRRRRRRRCCRSAPPRPW